MCIYMTIIWILTVKKTFWIPDPFPSWELNSLQGSCLLAPALQNTVVHEEKVVAFSQQICFKTGQNKHQNSRKGTQLHPRKEKKLFYKAASNAHLLPI